VKELLKSVFCQKTLANTNIAKIKVAPFFEAYIHILYQLQYLKYDY